MMDLLVLWRTPEHCARASWRSGEGFGGLYGGSHSKTSDKKLSILFAIVCLHAYNIVVRANSVHSRVSRFRK